MKIDLPPNFDMEKPHKELIYCPCCRKYQHFSFNRPRRSMWCNGCGSKFKFDHINLGQSDTKSSTEHPTKRREKYGPPKYLMVYNHWKEHPEFSVYCLWRFYYWDDYSLPTILRYVHCIEKDLEGLEKV